MMVNHTQQQLPDRPFHNRIASKSGDLQILCYSGAWCDGLGSFKLVKESVGLHRKVVHTMAATRQDLQSFYSPSQFLILYRPTRYFLLLFCYYFAIFGGKIISTNIYTYIQQSTTITYCNKCYSAEAECSCKSEACFKGIFYSFSVPNIRERTVGPYNIVHSL